MLRKYVPPDSQVATVHHALAYHPASGDQRERYEALRAKAIEMADEIMALTPGSREQSLALTHLQDALMWANAAIAIHE